MNRFSFVARSSNSKTGPIPVTMTDKASCPSACELKGSGCYAGQGMVNIHWNRLANPQAAQGQSSSKGQGITFEALLEAIKGLPEGQLWRHNVAGDLPHTGDEQTVDTDKVLALARSNEGKRGFTYTHHRVKGNDSIAKRNQSIINASNNLGFIVNLSANSPAEADELLALDIGPVVCILPAEATEGERVLSTPEGHPIIVCPAARTENAAKDISCATCKLCSNKDRVGVIGFPSHGVQKKKAQRFIKISKA